MKRSAVAIAITAGIDARIAAKEDVATQSCSYGTMCMPQSQADIDILRIFLEAACQHDSSKHLWKKIVAIRSFDGYTPFLLACRGG